MADLSAETQAIISELDKQGKLLRNDGRTNSIKMVRQDLAKFEPIFISINKGIGSMAEKINSMVSLSATESEGASRIATDDLDDEYVGLQKEAAELTIKNANQREKLEAEQMARDEVARKQKEKDDRKAETEKNKIMSQGLISMARDNKMGMFKGVLKYGLLGFAGFNIIKGAVDQMFDGAASEFLNNVDWTSLSEGFNRMTSWITSDIWKTLATGLAAWGALEFGLPFMVNTAGELIKLSAFKSALSGITSDNIKNTGGFPGLRVGIAGALGAALAMGMPAIKTFIRESMMGMTPAELEKAQADPGILDAAGYAAIGGTLGFMFGPTGALAGAVLGFAVGLGSMLIDNLKDDVKKAGANEEVEDLAITLRNLQDKQKELETYRKNMKADGMSDDEIDKAIAKFGKEYLNLDTAIITAEEDLAAAVERYNTSNALAAEEVKNKEISDTKLVPRVSTFGMAMPYEEQKTLEEFNNDIKARDQQVEQILGKSDDNLQLAASLIDLETVNARIAKREKKNNETYNNMFSPFNWDTYQFNLSDETITALLNLTESSEQLGSLQRTEYFTLQSNNKGGDVNVYSTSGDTHHNRTVNGFIGQGNGMLSPVGTN